MSGDAGDDILSGGGGRDTLSGGAGSDTLTGGNSRDSLSGGTGSDTLTGGGGRDTFIFDGMLGLGEADTVTDFDGNRDTLDLSQVVSLDLGSQSINDYVTVTEAGGDTVVAVSPNGGGTGDPDNEAVFVLNGVTGLGSAQDMFDNAQLVINEL